MNAYTSPPTNANSNSIGNSASLKTEVPLPSLCKLFGSHLSSFHRGSIGGNRALIRLDDYEPKKSAITALASGGPVTSRQNWLTTSFNNNSERQERAALTLQIDKASELGKHSRSGLKAVRIAERQGRDVVNRPTLSTVPSDCTLLSLISVLGVGRCCAL